MYGYVYLTTNKETGDTYVGQHVSSAYDPSYIGSGVNLRRQIKKYGLQCFDNKILQKCDTARQLDICEETTIAKYRRRGMANLNIYRGRAGLGTAHKQPGIHNQTDITLVDELREETVHLHKQIDELMSIIDGLQHQVAMAYGISINVQNSTEVNNNGFTR